MKIESVQTDHYRIPLPVVLSDSTHGSISHFDFISVRIRSEDGAEGLGYTYAIRGGVGIRALIDRDLKPVLIREDPSCIEYLWDRMWWQLHYVGRGGVAGFAISAVDIALWDLKARSAGMPLWRLLGVNKARVSAYAGGVDLQFSREELREQTEAFLERGFRAIKMKVGKKKLSEDLDRVAYIRGVIGQDVPLMVDANMVWTVEEAIRAAMSFSDLGVYWLEEPTLPEDVEGHFRILREGGLPIAAGENLRTLREFCNMINRGAVSFPEPDVSNIGGVTVWMKVAHLAEAHHLPVTSHGVQDLHVHLLAAVPNASYLEVHGFGLDPYMVHGLQLDDGEAIAPDRPGHGVELDWEALDPFRDRAD